MTIAKSVTASGETWTNVLSEATIVAFQFGELSPPVLSADKHTLTYTFATGTVTFRSTGTLGLNPPTGTVNGLDVPNGTYTGLTFTLDSFLSTVRDGDIEGLNKLLWNSRDTITGGAGDDLVRGFGGGDRITGGAGADTLVGDIGNDRLFGGTGNDILLGGLHNDKLFGQDGDDRLLGGAGIDLLVGGRGHDNLYGGAGADTFAWNGYSEFFDRTAGLYNIDVIHDFSHADGDKIDLSRLDANRYVAGNQEFTFVAGAFGSNSPGQVHVVATGNAQVFQIELNTDTDAQAEYAITVISLDSAPSAADLIL